MNYEEIIQRFLSDMASVEASTEDYIDALNDAAAEIEAAIDAAKGDLKT